MDFLQLEDKTIVIFGVANRKSVAYHIGKTITAAGAKPVYVVRSESRREQLQSLLESPSTSMPATPADEPMVRAQNRTPKTLNPNP